MKILFVCTGNTCRSAMCAGYFSKLCQEAGLKDVEALSAGVFASQGSPASPAALQAMSLRGVDLSGHRSTPLSRELLEASDLVVPLGAGHKARICALCPEAMDRTRLLLEFADRPGSDVDDPFGGGLREYEACFEEMKPALDNLLLETMEAARRSASSSKE